MGQVLIRNLPEELIETYKTKARLNGKSLEQVLRDLMMANAPFTPEERVAFSREILKLNSGPSVPLRKDEIREGLE
jgi:antitoxin FitA